VINIQLRFQTREGLWQRENEYIIISVRIFLAVSETRFQTPEGSRSTGIISLSFGRLISRGRAPLTLTRPRSFYRLLFILAGIIGNCEQVSPEAPAPQKFNQLDRETFLPPDLTGKQQPRGSVPSIANAYICVRACTHVPTNRGERYANREASNIRTRLSRIQARTAPGILMNRHPHEISRGCDEHRAKIRTNPSAKETHVRCALRLHAMTTKLARTLARIRGGFLRIDPLCFERIEKIESDQC